VALIAIGSTLRLAHFGVEEQEGAGGDPRGAMYPTARSGGNYMHNYYKRLADEARQRPTTSQAAVEVVATPRAGPDRGLELIGMMAIMGLALVARVRRPQKM
jgi:hypothetical protein